MLYDLHHPQALPVVLEPSVGGHETVQEIDGQRMPFDDRRVVTQVLEGLA